MPFSFYSSIENRNQSNKIIAIAIAIVIVLLSIGIAVIIGGVNTDTLTNESTADEIISIGGIYVDLTDNTTEKEAIATVDRIANGMEYRLKYNTDDIANSYYVEIDENNYTYKRDKLRQAEKWIETSTDTKKGKYVIVSIWDPLVEEEDFLIILEKQNLCLKKRINCYVVFEDEKWMGQNKEKIKEELRKNERVIGISFDYVEMNDG
ncbi:UPF0228 family protein [Methanohalophilus sp.]